MAANMLAVRTDSIRLLRPPHESHPARAVPALALRRGDAALFEAATTSGSP